MWKTMSDEQKTQLTKIYIEGGISGPKFVEAAWQLGIKPESLARYARNYKRYNELTTSTSTELVEGYVSLPAFHSKPKLTDITKVEPDSDAEEWVQWLISRSETEPLITVMHLSDMHEPFKNDMATNVAFQMVEIVQPDVIVVGSDFWDFYLMTTFGTNPEVKMESYDELELLESYWNRFINALNKIAPNAMFVFIWGNHERRIMRYVDNHSVNLHRTIFREFKRIIRCGGRVKYIGDVDHVRMGPLKIEHGSRYNVHAPKSRLEDEGGQVCIWMGHGHKLKWFSMSGADFSVNAIMSGCLCTMPPHYLPIGVSAPSGQKWQHGTAVATFDINDRLVSFENVEFKTTPLESYGLFRSKRLSSLNSPISPY